MEFNIAGLIYLDQGTWDVDLHHNLLWAALGSAQQGIWYNTACVDIRERGNLFHKEFTRTCAELKPEDFPEGKPFRFGHDFQNPPLRTAWPQIETMRIEAASCSASSAGVTKTATGLTGLRDGDWFASDKVDLSQGWQSAVIRFAGDDQAMNTDRAGRTTYYEYDAVGRLITTIYPDDTPGDLSHNPRAWTFYDLSGRVIAQTDENTNSTWFGYDAAGRQVTRRTAPGGACCSAPVPAGQARCPLRC